jgi:hypothetical protein
MRSASTEKVKEGVIDEGKAQEWEVICIAREQDAKEGEAPYLGPVWKKAKGRAMNTHSKHRQLIPRPSPLVHANARQPRWQGFGIEDL